MKPADAPAVSVDAICGSAALKVLEVDYKADPRWMGFLESHPDALVYHHPGWLAALESEYGQKCTALACVDPEGDYQGVLPLLETRGLPLLRCHGLGPRLSSLPRTPLAGPLYNSVPALRALIEAAVQRTQARPGVQLQLKLGARGLEDHVGGLGCQRWRTSYVCVLPPRQPGGPYGTSSPAPLGELRFGSSRNHLRIKCSVSKALKLGVKVRAATTSVELRGWYRLYLETMRKNAVPPRPYRFFHSAWTSLQPLGLMRLWVAEHGAGRGPRMVAGVIILKYRGRAFYAFAGCSSEGYALQANDALQWHAINDSWRGGCHSYDFGEVPDDHGQLAAYKRKWGADAAQLYRYYYPEGVKSDGGHRFAALIRPARALWRRLPLGITAAICDRIFRYL